MSSKRSIKKEVRYTCGNLAAECIIAKNIVPGADAAALSNIVIKIAQLQDVTLRKISFAFDKVAKDFSDASIYRKERHAYVAKAFKSLRKDFNQHVLEIVKEMNAAIPAEQKELNKKAVAK